MPEREPPRLNPEDERFEDLYEAFFGHLEELVNEAEDLGEDIPSGVMGEDEDSTQLWEELREQYATTSKEWERRKDSIDEAMHAKLAGSLLDLRERAEKVFGKKLE